MTHDNITYDDLVIRYGKDLAFDFLLTIEKAARVKEDISQFDEAVRWQRALQALDNANMAA